MKTINLDIDPRGVATLTLARPDKRNALSREMISELADAASALRHDNTVRVVILAAEGETFCAGGDLGWMRDQMVTDPETRRREATKLAQMMNALNQLSVPLIGRVHASAFGGGVGLMSVCDAVIALDDCRFGLTETKLGLIPATIGPYVIARMGEARARRVFMSSRLFGCAEAQELGLVAKVEGSIDALDAAIEAEVASYLQCAPGAVADAKEMVRRLGPTIDDDVISRSINDLMVRWDSAEADEGTRAFFEKRPPKWAK